MKTAKRRIKTATKILWRLTFFGIIAFVTFITLINYGVFGKMPSIQDLQNPSASIASEVFADDNQLMGKFYLEDRSPVEMKDISPNVINALIATEDERFYEHSGIDLKAIARAFYYRGKRGGGSTITQQLALNLFGGQRATNTFNRTMQKLKEWVIAVKLERNFTKDEIISYYLNTVPFGDNIYGIRNAARTFFQKEPAVLTVDEAAVLIGTLRGNSQYSPRRHPKEALERRNIVLDQMVRNEKLSAAQAERLKTLPIPLKYKKLDQNEGIAPYFRENVLKDEVKNMLKDKKKPNGDPYDIYRDGLKIYTTINPAMQKYGEEAVAKNMPNKQAILNSQGNIRSGSVWKGHEPKLEQYLKETDRWKDQKEDGMSDEENRRTFNVKQPMKVFAWNDKRQRDTIMSPFDSVRYHRQFLQSGFMAMDPVSGIVKCWVGGVDYKTFKYDHVNVKSSRQVGSTIKPMLYALAIEEAGFTPESPLQNVPQYFPGSGWVPAKQRGGGSVPMFKALAHSLNCCAAYLMKQVGPKRFAEFLATCNVQHKIDPYPSIALGSCDLSLYEMLWMYTMFAGRGFNTKPQFITRIEDRNGNVLVQVQQLHKEVISEVTAYTMAKMMGGAIKFGTARDWNSYGIKAETGAKTGTTNDNSDAWFMCYTPQLLCGTWVGCDDRFVRFATTGVGQGGKAALPTCGNFMKAVYNDKTLGYDDEAEFTKPTIGKEEIIYDYIQGINAMYRPDAQAQDVGNGETADYMNYGDDGGYTESADTTSVKTKPETDNSGYGDETPKKEEIVKQDTAKAIMPELSRKERRKLEKEKKDLEKKRKQEEKAENDY